MEPSPNSQTEPEPEPEPEPPHIIVIPSPGMGHLIPLAEFSKHLHTNHHYNISILIPTTTPATTTAQATYLSTLPPSISYTFLPQVDPTLLPPDVAHEVTITLAHNYSLPHARDAVEKIRDSTRSVAGIVTDLFGTEYFAVAKEVGVGGYLYFTSNSMCLSLLVGLLKLDEVVEGEFRDMVDPVVLPGCVPLHGKDFVDPVQNRKDEAYKVILDHIRRYNLADGIFVNTFTDLEPNTIHALQNDYLDLPPIYPIGPLIQSSGSSQGLEDQNHCLSWLDLQPPGSVLFVSFGSGGTLSYEQLIELAIGLEKSGKRFLWVVRSPSNTSYGSFFSGKSQDDPFGFLPDGYVDRVKDRGLLVPSWAPQIEVLGHMATGGFLSHCGWNSILESIVKGVPLIAWPLYAEQKMNAVLLNEGIRVALRPRVNEGGLVEADEIANVVRELMEGDEGMRVRRKMKELSECAKKAVSEDGDSTKALNQVVLEWSRTTI